MKVSVFGNTIIGKQRDHNEDSFIILNDNNGVWQEANDQHINLLDSRGLIFAVADGMGGTNAGEVASAIALRTVKEKLEEIPNLIKSHEQIQKIFDSIIQTINSNIIDEANKNKEVKGMGTTIVLGWILNNELYITWIGDSRCYHYNKEKYKQLLPFSDDHSLVWSLVKNGQITPEEARLSSESNLLLQSLGDTLQDPVTEFKWISLSDKDRILLCSDGLNSMLSAVGIQQILDFSDSTKETCESLINAANNAGGHDNITAILVDILETNKSEKSLTIGKSFRKKWIKGMISLLFLAIISIIVYITNEKYEYLNKIKGVFIQPSKENINPSAEITTSDQRSFDTDSIHSDEKNIFYSETNVNPEKETTDQITTKSNQVVSMIDAAQAKKSLQIILDRIEIIKNKIEPVKPGKSEYQQEFYSTHSKNLEHISHSLDSLKNQINRYAEISENEIVGLKVTRIEENKILSFFSMIDSLNGFTEKILSSQQRH